MIIRDEERLKGITGQIIGASIDIHRTLGPGLLEKVYHDCLCYELDKKGLVYIREPKLKLNYKDTEINFELKPDLIVENSVIVELKAVLEMHPVYEAQILSYLKLTGIVVGLLINFHTPVLVQGIRRFTMQGNQLPDDWEKHRAGEL